MAFRRIMEPMQEPAAPRGLKNLSVLTDLGVINFFG